jgi:hypothetical protein
MYCSHSIIVVESPDKHFRKLLNHYKSRYRALTGFTFAEIDFGHGQTMTMSVSQGAIQLTVIYKSIDKFAAINRSVRTQVKKTLGPRTAEIDWTTRSLRQPKILLNLPRPIDEEGSPIDILNRIFHLGAHSDAAMERRILDCILAIHPPPGADDTAIADLDRRGMAYELAEWLALQDLKGLLDIKHPAESAQMLFSMMFGGFAPLANGGASLPGSHELLSYLKTCIVVFVRGHQPDISL